MNDAIEAVARTLATNLEIYDSNPEEMWPAYTSEAIAAIETHLSWLEDNGFAVVPEEHLRGIGVWVERRHEGPMTALGNIADVWLKAGGIKDAIAAAKGEG